MFFGLIIVAKNEDTYNRAGCRPCRVNILQCLLTLSPKKGRIIPMDIKTAIVKNQFSKLKKTASAVFLSTDLGNRQQATGNRQQATIIHAL